MSTGCSVLPQSSNAGRLKENFDIFSWSLTDEELQKLSEIEQKKLLTATYFIHPDGPFKSLDDLWDGEY